MMPYSSVSYINTHNTSTHHISLNSYSNGDVTSWSTDDGHHNVV